MSRPSFVEVQLDVIVHNFHALLGLTPAGATGLAVVKADAYGHGAVPVTKALAAAGVTDFAVACTGEAMELRDSGIQTRILIMGYPMPEDALVIAAHGFECTVSSLEQARYLHDAATQHNACIPIHVKFDTGMGRVGFDTDNPLALIHRLRDLSGLHLAGVMTHLSAADAAQGAAFTRGQLTTFAALKREIETAGFDIPRWHAAGTAGILSFPESHYNVVRPGIGLYGCYPTHAMPRTLALRQAMTWKTRLAHIREMPPQSSISYGRTWSTERASRIALLPVGYADGLNRRLSNRGAVLVRGQRAPIVGRVCMDLTLVDVTEIPAACDGDEVVLLGSQGTASISLQEVAQVLDTIPYVVMTGAGSRVQRRYPG